jgi:effector-binding domain-containing protein
MIRNIFIGLVVLVAAAVGVAFVLPQHPHTQRETIIAATPEQVFAVVDDMSRWNDWAPWAKMDPDMKQKFDGPAKGVGAKMSWTSAKLGNGSMTVIESTPFSQIKEALDFDGNKAVATFTFAPADGGTKVVWSFDSDAGMNPIARYFGLMVDSMVGKDYETGLASLKVLAEADAKAAAELEQQQAAAAATPSPDAPQMAAAADPNKAPEVVTVEARPIVMMRASANAADAKSVSDALGAANQKILDYAMKNNLALGGAPLAITVSHDAAGKWVFDAALPLDDKPATTPAPEGGVKVGQTFAGKVVKLTHKGPYTSINDTYARIHAYTKENNLKEGTVSWEEYVNDPGETAEEDLLTNVYVVLKD